MNVYFYRSGHGLHATLHPRKSVFIFKAPDTIIPENAMWYACFKLELLGLIEHVHDEWFEEEYWTTSNLYKEIIWR